MSKTSSLYIRILLKDIGKELKRVREQQNLTVEQAAEQAGFFHPYLVEHIEAGSRKMTFKILRLLKVYNQKINISLEEAGHDRD